MLVGIVALLLERLKVKSVAIKPESARFISTAYDAAINKLKKNFPPRQELDPTKVKSLVSPKMFKYISKLAKQKSQPKLTPIEKIQWKYNVSPKISNIILQMPKPISKKHIIHNKKIPIKTRLAIQYNVMTHIPRKMITRLIKILPSKTTIAGSYRRGLAFSSDVDILTSTPLDKYISDLKSRLKIRIYEQGESKVSCLVKKGGLVFKLDIFRETDGIADLLFLTGSKEHNLKMRKKAKALGLKLNRYGLFKNTTKLKYTSEEDIFKLLGMKYVKPSDR